MENTNRFRKCHCGKDIKHIGNYPLEGYNETDFASALVYACSDGHEQHIPRYKMTNECPVCKSNDWNFALIGTDNSEWKCKVCEFRVVQTGSLTFWVRPLDFPTESCLLCNAESLIVEKTWNFPVYASEQNKDLKIEMLALYCECMNCSASYSKKKCPYCSSFSVAVSEKRERKASGRDYAIWQQRCHCWNCKNEWYLGSGWSD